MCILSLTLDTDLPNDKYLSFKLYPRCSPTAHKGRHYILDLKSLTCCKRTDGEVWVAAQQPMVGHGRFNLDWVSVVLPLQQYSLHSTVLSSMIMPHVFGPITQLSSSA